MYKLIRNSRNIVKYQIRTLISQTYHCNEIWENRLNSPLLRKVNLDDLYYDLDLRFQKTRQISAVDVDIFANSITNDLFIDELLDLVHKLRLSAETGSTLNSTGHATIRVLKAYGKIPELLNVLDDRLNYGIFLDHYTANFLLDYFWDNQDFVSGARVAAQLMLQEDCDHDLFRYLSLLHIYNYILKPQEWPQPSPPEEPEEEVKIRVAYLRNPHDDNHFDLKDPNKIIGKTLIAITKNRNDSLNKSFNILGWILYSDIEKGKSLIDSNSILVKEIVEHFPGDLKSLVKSTESIDVQNVLLEQIQKIDIENDIKTQCDLFKQWDSERVASLEEQKNELLKQKRLKDVEELKKSLKERETKLWFFDNEEQIESEIEARSSLVETVTTQKQTAKVDEDYVPPEIRIKK